MLGNFKKLFRGSHTSGPPRITKQPYSVHDAVPGSSVALLVMTDAKQSYSTTMNFEWHYSSPTAGTLTQWTPVEPAENGRVTGMDTSTLLFRSVLQTDAGSYRCQITNSSGVSRTKAATLTVVVPPEIEAHPKDIVDIRTGSEAVFSVVVSWPSSQTANGGARGKRGGGGGGGGEDLQFVWELLRPEFSFDHTSANGTHNSQPVTSEETPHERIFREHHPDLRHYLNTSSILPYLSKYSLVTADQLEELTLPVLTNTRKVDLLLNWLPRSTVDFLEKFVLCLKEASDHLAHAELASTLEGAIEGEKIRRGSQVSHASLSISPMATSPSPSAGQEVGDVTGREWEVVREEEESVEGTTTPTLHLLHVEKRHEGQYRCRVVYKNCPVVSEPASLFVLEDDEIVRRLLQECLDNRGDAAVAEFLEKYGNTSKLAKKALVTVLQSQCDPQNLVQAFTSRQVPVNFIIDGMSPLHLACVKGHWRIVQHLVNRGASKTTLNQDGRNAVHLVCERGDNNSLQFLIHTGAETLVNVQDKYGKTPLHLVCEAAQKITPSKLISQDMRDIKTVIQNLLTHQTSLRTGDENGQTPLHLAAKAGHPWIVEVFLLCNTAGLNDQDKNSDTALHIATSLNWPEVVVSLLERGADETLENKDGVTPLALAEAKGHTYVVDILQRKPGTVKRDRKQTVYVTDAVQSSRPKSANLPDTDQPCGSSTSRLRGLSARTPSEEKQERRSWLHLLGSPQKLLPGHFSLTPPSQPHDDSTSLS